MITAERLEELIKQGATVYHIDGLEIKLLCNLVEVCGDTLYAPAGFQWSIKNLYETKDQAEWVLKTVAERTERFEPPMWEDIELEKRYVFRFIINNEFIYFKVGKHENAKFNNITIFNITGDKMIFSKWDSDTTKENYIKACERVRDLFNEGGAKC